MSPYDRNPPRNGNIDRANAQWRKNLALGLPSTQRSDHPSGPHATDFFDGLGAGGPKASMMRNILCGVAARRMTDEQLVELAAFLAAGRERDALKLEALAAPACIVENARRLCDGGKVLDREIRRRGLAPAFPRGKRQ